jgi:dimethylargininase
MLDVNRDMPDSVFVEDTAVVFPEVAVLASMGAASRRGEPAGLEPELRKYREVRQIRLPALIDGGDVVVTGKTVLAGLSSRTNEAGIAALSDVVAPFGYSVHAVRVTGCLHLKSACTALLDGRLLVNPSWIAMSDLDGLPSVPIVPDEPFAADVALVRETIVAGAAFPQTNDKLRQMGFALRSVDLSEFAKAEGGVTCLSLIFEEQVLPARTGQPPISSTLTPDGGE